MDELGRIDRWIYHAESVIRYFDYIKTTGKRIDKPEAVEKIRQELPTLYARRKALKEAQ